LGLLFLCVPLQSITAEDFRVIIAGAGALSPDTPAGNSINLNYNSTALVYPGSDTRFYRGIELELVVPQEYIYYRGSLAIVIYTALSMQDGKDVPAVESWSAASTPSPENGPIADFSGTQYFIEAIPNKLQSAYQIPVRPGSGLKSGPYTSVLPALGMEAFPLAVRIMPVIKGLAPEIESMTFVLTYRPVLSDEGALKLSISYPPNLADKPWKASIDDKPLDDHAKELLLKEGEHHLSITSEDYRNENRVFVVERTKTLDLAVALQDPTPLLLFDGPQDAQIFLDNVPVTAQDGPVQAPPGPHEVRFELSDYAIIKKITTERGKTYRVALQVDVLVSEVE
jgi:hypothetical protein